VSASRGALLASLIGLMIVSSFYFIEIVKKPREYLNWRIVLVLVSLLTIILSIYFGIDYIENDRTLNRFSNIFTDTSVTSRLETWRIAWGGIKARPILGWGQENFIALYTVNSIPYEEITVWADRAHNIIFHWLVNAGLFGLISYLSIFVMAFYIVWSGYRKGIISKKETIIIITAISVYFIHNVFTFDTINTYLIFFALLAYIDSINLMKTNSLINKIKIANQNKKTLYLTGISLAVLLLFLMISYYINYKPMQKTQQFMQISKSLPGYNSYMTLLNDINKVLSNDTFGNRDMIYGMINISNHIIRNNQFAQAGALEFIEATAKEIEKEIKFNIYDLQFMTSAIYFFKELSVYAPSFVKYTDSLIEESKRINPRYEMLDELKSDIFVLKQEYENAFIIIKKLAYRYPENDELQFKLALAAIYSRNNNALKISSETIGKLRKRKNLNIANGKESIFSISELHQFAKAYEKINLYLDALAYYDEIMHILYDDKLLQSERDIAYYRDSERKAVIHYDVARIYSFLGDTKNAALETEKAEQLAPHIFLETNESQDSNK
jgi:tetratricopeptide (TPR) repeat protein